MDTYTVKYNEETGKIVLNDGERDFTLDPNSRSDMKWYKRVMNREETIFEKIDADGNVISRSKDDAPLMSRKDVRAARRAARQEVREETHDEELPLEEEIQENRRSARVRSPRARVAAARQAARTRNFVRNHSKGLKIAGIAAGGTLVAGGITAGTVALVKNHKAKVATLQNTEDDNVLDSSVITAENFNEIINEKFANNETAREFYTTLRNTLYSLNVAASGPNFVLEKDKETLSVLRFNHNEVMAAMLALNDYSAQELYSIFGDYSLDQEEVFKDYTSFINKISVYYMNGKEPIGASSLIRDEANRTLFEKFEEAIIKFNKEQTHENADRLIRYFEYYIVQSSNKYVYALDMEQINKMSKNEFDAYVKKMSTDGRNSTDRFELNSKTSSYVKHLIINMVQSYRNANSQPDYKTYRIVSSGAGNFDSLFTKDSLAQVQKGQSLDEYFNRENETALTIVETIGCETEKIENHINDLISSLTELQNKARTELAELFTDKGLNELADKVLDGISLEEYEAIRANKDAQEIFESYASGKLINSEFIALLLTNTFKDLDEYLFDYAHGRMDETGKGVLRDDIATLFNNRVRGLEKIKEAVSGPVVGEPTVTTVISGTTEKEVDYSDLTDEEKASVDKQKEQIDKEEYQVEIDGKTFDKGEASTAANEGFVDGTSYANNGSYSYHDVINNINPNAPSVVPTNGSLFNTAANAYAFEGVVITTADSQIQAKLASDLSNYIAKNSNKYADSYKEGWLLGVKQVLDRAVSVGAVVRSDAERLYQEALDAANKNNSETNTSNDTTTETVDNTTTSTDTTTTTDTITDDNTENEFDGLDLYDPDDEILNPRIESSIPGVDDVYDFDFDGTDNSYVAYTEEPTYDASYTAYTEEQTVEDVKVLVKTP